MHDENSRGRFQKARTKNWELSREMACVEVVVVEWFHHSTRIIIDKGADLSDFFVDFR